jgi:hypothetical protein
MSTVLNPRDVKPETTGLTWRFVGKTLPVVFGAYFAAIAVVHGLFLALPVSAHPFRLLAFAAVLVPISVAYLYPFMLRAMGSSAKAERREAVWSSGAELGKLAGRQSARYLSVAFPVEIVAMAAASFLVTVVFHAFGLK